MSDSGQHSLRAVGPSERASFVIPVDTSGMPSADVMRPIRVQCAKCPNRVFKYVKVRTMYALPKSHPLLRKEGVDRQIVIEMWCLSCLRGANVEDDYQRTPVSIGGQ